MNGSSIVAKMKKAPTIFRPVLPASRPRPASRPMIANETGNGRVRMAARMPSRRPAWSRRMPTSRLKTSSA